ncbi:MAG: flippase [Candidatus Aenigmarchaeota archaeon]|nr:flippase [Candidatus Aenigmarchaeota archaeon]
MLKKIKSTFRSDDKKRLLENFLSLSVLQGANYILPLLTLPYLVRVLEPDKFGLIMFAQAFIQFFIILTDYGFNLSATREISIHRNDKNKIAEIFNSVMAIKLGLLLFSFLIMSIVVFSFDKFHNEWIIYYLTFGRVVGQVLFPVWFFQGMERMKYITSLNIIAKLIFTALIFMFVRNKAEYLYVPAINSLGFLTAGFLALWLIFKDFHMTFIFPSMENMKFHFRDGWHIFTAQVAISIYTVSNTFILGIFTTTTIVGYYAAAEKLIKAIQGLLSPVSQSIYPFISKLANESKNKAIRFIRKATFIIGGTTFALSCITLIFADVIVKIVLGTQYTESVNVLRIISFLPFIIGLSNIFGVQTMLTFNYKRPFSNILIAASIINIIIAFTLVPPYQHIGVSISVLISELFVTLAMFIYLWNRGIRVLEGEIV